MASTIVRGLPELRRALAKIDREIDPEARKELKKVAQPVADTAKTKLARYQGAKVGQIGIKVSMKTVAVTDRARKTTGMRPDFGNLIMTRGLEPALEEHADEVVPHLEEALDRLANRAGF